MNNELKIEHLKQCRKEQWARYFIYDSKIRIESRPDKIREYEEMKDEASEAARKIDAEIIACLGIQNFDSWRQVEYYTMSHRSLMGEVQRMLNTP